jgi:sporulation protein YlmC with PRC-barrel domain
VALAASAQAQPAAGSFQRIDRNGGGALNAPAAEQTPERFRVISEPVKATQLIGSEVRTSAGKPLGSIGDLVFDLAHNRVREARVAGRGYPLYMLKRPPGSAELVLEIPVHPVEQSWENMQLVSASTLLHGPVADVVIDAFWGDVLFAVMPLDGALRPVPLDAFGLRDGGPVLHVAREKVAALDGFTPEELDARMRDREFLERTARAAHRLTPLPR